MTKKRRDNHLTMSTEGSVEEEEEDELPSGFHSNGHILEINADLSHSDAQFKPVKPSYKSLVQASADKRLVYLPRGFRSSNLKKNDSREQTLNMDATAIKQARLEKLEHKIKSYIPFEKILHKEKSSDLSSLALRSVANRGLRDRDKRSLPAMVPTTVQLDVNVKTGRMVPSLKVHKIRQDRLMNGMEVESGLIKRIKQKRKTFEHLIDKSITKADQLLE